MRIDSFEIFNYKGLHSAKIEGLSTQALVVLSGKNGTGKTLVLEALLLNWTGSTSLVDFVGPWSDELFIDMTITFSDDDLNAIRGWYERLHQALPALQTSYHLRHSANKLKNEWKLDREDDLLKTVRSKQFTTAHRFSIIDMLPAHRSINASSNNHVDLGMFDIERVDQERQNQADSVRYRGGLQLPDVSSYLLTLHYQQFLAREQGIVVDDEYGRITEVFERTTGKKISRPQYDRLKGGRISVLTPSGQRHELEHLSSGELEMIGLAYFIRRLSADGGILFIDEPEQHLHPTLQAGLFESMRDIASRAQVFVVSHSVKLIALAPTEGLVQVSASTEPASNQLSQIQMKLQRAELISDLGIVPADILQNDLLLVVEGETDSKLLRGVFPIELGRAHVVVAGSSKQVLQAHRTLSNMPPSIPWLCLIDRDLRSMEESVELQIEYQNLHVWPVRSIESLFLNAKLLVATKRHISVEVTVNRANVESMMVELAADLQNDVLEEIVRFELRDQFPMPAPPSTGSRFDKLRQELHAAAATTSVRADSVEAVVDAERRKLEQRWASDWRELVDSKVMLAKLAKSIGLGRNDGELLDMLAAQARDNADVRPPELELFKSRLLSLFGTPPKGLE